MCTLGTQLAECGSASGWGAGGALVAVHRGAAARAAALMPHRRVTPLVSCPLPPCFGPTAAAAAVEGCSTIAIAVASCGAAPASSVGAESSGGACGSVQRRKGHRDLEGGQPANGETCRGAVVLVAVRGRARIA